MNIKDLFTEDRGVSPVIGVILMVAITVILAAVIGAFVLGLGDQASDSAPSASFSYDFDGTNNVTISHSGGENIDNSTIDVTVAGQTPYESGNDDGTGDFSASGWNGTISTGDELDIGNRSDSDEEVSGETVRVIWNAPGGGSSNTLSERTWP